MAMPAVLCMFCEAEISTWEKSETFADANESGETCVVVDTYCVCDRCRPAVPVFEEEADNSPPTWRRLRAAAPMEGAGNIH